MALEVGVTDEKEGDGPKETSNGGPEQNQKPEEEDNSGDADVEEEDEDEDEEDEEDEPRLKYTSLTKNVRPLYRNGDATSTFFVAGDKMVRWL